MLFLLGCSRGPKQETPDQALAHGKALLQTMNYAPAIPEFRLAAGSKALAKEAHYFLGVTFEQMGDLPKAQAELSEVASQDDHFWDVRIRLAKIMVRAPDPQEAEWGGEWAEREVGQTGDHASADAYYVLGVREFRQGHPDDAVKYLKRALSVQPGHLAATKALVIVLLIQGDTGGAESALLALSKNPQNSEALGEFYRLTGDLAAAEHWLRDALEHDKTTFAAVNLADTLWMMGRRKEALDLLGQPFVVGANQFEQLHALAALANGDADQSVAELAGLTRKQDFSPDAQSRLLAALMAANRLDQAKSVAEERLRVAPTDVRAVLDHAAVSMAGGPAGLQAAMQDLAKLQLRGVDSDLFRYVAAVVAFRQGQRSETLNELTQALSINPDLLAARVNFARLLSSENKPQWAAEIMDDTPLAERRRPSAFLERFWLLAGPAEKATAKRRLQAASLSLPVLLASDSQGTTTQLSPQPFEDSLRFDLLEYPQGPVFQETDLDLLSKYPLNKHSIQWLTF
jgi:tetratricopeptide (TPR) repeat protein